MNENLVFGDILGGKFNKAVERRKDKLKERSFDLSKMIN